MGTRKDSCASKGSRQTKGLASLKRFVQHGHTKGFVRQQGIDFAEKVRSAWAHERISFTEKVRAPAEEKKKIFFVENYLHQIQPVFSKEMMGCV